MKRLLVFLFSLSSLMIIQAQTEGVSINSTGNAPDPSAMLEVESTNKGFLMPRMDSTSRKAIVDPAQGLMVYDSTTQSFWYFDTTWQNVGQDNDPENEIELPAGGFNGQILQTDGSGSYMWINDRTGGTVSDGSLDNIRVIKSFPTAGNGRGTYSVDLQTHRFSGSQVASGFCAVIGGGWRNIAYGAGATVSGGQENSAANGATIGGGTNNTADNLFSTIGGGWLNKANGRYSTIPGGTHLEAKSFNETVIGSYNLAIGGNPTNWINTDPLFVVGNGQDNNTRSNALTLLKNGNLGLGTSTPGTTLHVIGQIRYEDDNQAAGHVLTSDANGVASWQAPVSGNTDNLGDHTATQNLTMGSYFLSGDGDDEGVQIDGNGNVGINKRLIMQGSYWSDQFGGALKLINSGNVGAGITLQSDNPGGKSYSLLSTGTNALPGAGHFGIYDNTSLAYRLTIRDNGRIGIGTTNPTRAKVEIVGSVDHQLGTYGYLNPDGSTNVFTPTSPSPYSLYASHRIAASHFNAHSDIRIKQVQGLSNSEADLASLMQIEITDYRMRDTISHGHVLNKKVIAQQVAEVYPQAVTTNLTEVVPDIYQRADIQDGWIMLATDLQIGERVKLITEQASEVYEVSVVEEYRFQVKAPASHLPNLGSAFVYGREVNDFHTVDYEAISMLNVSATQEQQRRIEELEAKNAALKAKNVSFEARLQSLEAAFQSSSAIQTITQRN